MVCPRCGKSLAVSVPPQEHKAEREPAGSGSTDIIRRFKGDPQKKWIAVIAAVSVVLIAVIFLAVSKGRCQESGCSNKAVAGSDYCYSHKCVVPSCSSRQLDYSTYCYVHYKIYDDDADTSYVSPSQLRISNVTLSSNSSYTIAEGSITNTSNSTVKFVKIKGAFETRAGTVVDTDWTYAVGNEGLAPGESCKWHMSVSKDRSITQCSVSIIDFDT